MTRKTAKAETLPATERRRIFAECVLDQIRDRAAEELAVENPTTDMEWHANIRKALGSKRTMKRAQALAEAFVRKFYKDPETLFAQGAPLFALEAFRNVEGCMSRRTRQSAMYSMTYLEPFPEIPVPLTFREIFVGVRAEYRKRKRAAEESAAPEANDKAAA